MMKKQTLKQAITVMALVSVFSGGIVTACTQLSETEKDKSAGLNGGFEKVKNNLPANWLVYTPQTTRAGNFHYLFDNKTFKEGKQSLCIHVESCSEKGGRFSPGIAQEIPVKEGEKYRVSYWVKNTGTTFRITVAGVSAFERGKETEERSSKTFEWRQEAIEYTIPKGMSQMRIEVSVIKPGTFWIDGLELQKMQ
jgi:hypothetical protein